MDWAVFTAQITDVIPPSGFETQFYIFCSLFICTPFPRWLNFHPLIVSKCLLCQSSPSCWKDWILSHPQKAVVDILLRSPAFQKTVNVSLHLCLHLTNASMGCWKTLSPAWVEILHSRQTTFHAINTDQSWSVFELRSDHSHSIECYPRGIWHHTLHCCSQELGVLTIFHNRICSFIHVYFRLTVKRVKCIFYPEYHAVLSDAPQMYKKYTCTCNNIDPSSFI